MSFDLFQPFDAVNKNLRNGGTNIGGNSFEENADNHKCNNVPSKDVDIDNKLDDCASVGHNVNDGRVKVCDRVPIQYRADTIEISINNLSNKPLSSSVDGYEQKIKPTYLLIVGIKLCKKL